LTNLTGGKKGEKSEIFPLVCVRPRGGKKVSLFLASQEKEKKKKRARVVLGAHSNVGKRGEGKATGLCRMGTGEKTRIRLGKNKGGGRREWTSKGNGTPGPQFDSLPNENEKGGAPGQLNKEKKKRGKRCFPH